MHFLDILCPTFLVAHLSLPSLEEVWSCKSIAKLPGIGDANSRKPMDNNNNNNSSEQLLNITTCLALFYVYHLEFGTFIIPNLEIRKLI